jgi:hypothetical protein
VKPPILPGYVVFSKKGRDKGRYFVVLYTLDAEFVMIGDGDTRKLDHLKKKRRKHLGACPIECRELIDLLNKGQLKDSDIRKVLFPIANQTTGEMTPNENREG